MFKLDLEKAEEPEIKLETSAVSDMTEQLHFHVKSAQLSGSLNILSHCLFGD